ncbi:MAG: maleylpyruvate isomerase family mycothiol-dependent enzyme [Trebonia sp.]
MDVDQHVAALERDGALLADATATAGLLAPVPACPAWLVRDLVRHQAYVHAWAARHIAERPATVISGADEASILAAGPPDGELLGAYQAGLAALVRVLRSADPALECATFLPAPSPLAFWARRQAHETAVHRYDGQAAGGTADPIGAFDPGFAADGIDELIMGFAARRKRTGPGVTLLVRTLDSRHAWHYSWPADGRRQARPCDPAAPPPADCVLAGPASGLYLFLWNRCGADEAHATVTGDPSVLRAWNSGVHVRWG